MSDAPTAVADSAVSHAWRITPQGFFSRHYELFWGGQLVATLRMSLWTEGCEFSIAGHAFAIGRTSLWKDGFQLLAGDQAVCNVTKRFWSRQFELSTAEQVWILRPASWISRDYLLLAGEQIVGAIRPAGWFTRARVADFAVEVPPPVQVLAIFLVLLSERRASNAAAAGT